MSGSTRCVEKCRRASLLRVGDEMAAAITWTTKRFGSVSVPDLLREERNEACSGIVRNTALNTGSTVRSVDSGDAGAISRRRPQILSVDRLS